MNNIFDERTYGRITNITIDMNILYSRRPTVAYWFKMLRVLRTLYSMYMCIKYTRLQINWSIYFIFRGILSLDTVPTRIKPV